MIYRGERTIFFQSSLNIMLSVCIMCLLMAIGIRYYQAPRETASILAHFASTDSAKISLRYHYALTGDWPADTESTIYPHRDKYTLIGFHESEIEILDGTLQIPIIYGASKGEHISVRPAQPIADPIGPVHWVVGPGDQLDWRTIHGPDLTTVDPGMISKQLR